MLFVENQIVVKNFFVAVHQVTCLKNVLHLPVSAVPLEMGRMGKRGVGNTKQSFAPPAPFPHLLH